MCGQIAAGNEAIQKEQIKLKREENNLNKKNSYPAFEFREEKMDDGSTLYSLEHIKGEMNNVNFSISERIVGYGSYNEKPIYINQSIHYRHNNESKDVFKQIYGFNFNNRNVVEKFNILCLENNLNVYVSDFYITRYYLVSYMNFMHEFKDEHYIVGTDGTGRAIESPYDSIKYDNAINITGGFGSFTSEDIDDDSWLAKKLYEAVDRTIQR